MTTAQKFSAYMADVWETESIDALWLAQTTAWGGRKIGLGENTMPGHKTPGCFRLFLIEFPDGSRAWVSPAEVEPI